MCNHIAERGITPSKMVIIKTKLELILKDILEFLLHMMVIIIFISIVM
ncbi:hypothetical protein PROVALCAL_02987 [Providencia alcalifaciens DSM 30120]|uniref:Uncharacterized protein n=1 Tax=Providencia alcalifaciens DSM 30120 TaxID=520999 RepID=B6XHZ8_9GAMM|nr:hypothetical protein PROVALCAL_02987 [Providencia alcalifaciens DSM 30120]